MTNSLDKIYEEVKNDVIHLTLRWHIFDEFFSNRDHRDILNRNAPSLGYYIFKMFIDAIIVHIYKLTEVKKKTIGLKRLKKEVSKFDKQKELQASYENIITLQNNIKVWRHSVIAHRSEKQFHLGAIEPLPNIYRSEIAEIIYEIQKFMNQAEELMGNIQVKYSNVGHIVNTKYFFHLLMVGEKENTD